MALDQERIARLEQQIDNHDKSICTMATDIKEIKDKLLLRPSWAVTIVITFLSTLSVGLMVFVFSNFGGVNKQAAYVIDKIYEQAV